MGQITSPRVYMYSVWFLQISSVSCRNEVAAVRVRGEGAGADFFIMYVRCLIGFFVVGDKDTKQGMY